MFAKRFELIKAILRERDAAEREEMKAMREWNWKTCYRISQDEKEKINNVQQKFAKHTWYAWLCVINLGNLKYRLNEFLIFLLFYVHDEESW